MKTSQLAMAASALALAAASLTVTAKDFSFSNSSAITINDDTINDDTAASIYPSNIAVNGLSGNITNVSVTLNGISHTWPGDVNVVLVAPGGQKIALMQRVGSSASGAGCSADLVGAVLTFSAAAATNMSACPTASGSYLPTAGLNLSNSPAPAPAGPYSTDLTTLNVAGAGQNGIWTLYVSDHQFVDTGSISGGWTLNISDDTPTFTTCAAEGFTGPKLTLCRQVCEIRQSPSTLSNLIKLYMAIYRQEPPCAD